MHITSINFVSFTAQICINLQLKLEGEAVVPFTAICYATKIVDVLEVRSRIQNTKFTRKC